MGRLTSMLYSRPIYRRDNRHHLHRKPDRECHSTTPGSVCGNAADPERHVRSIRGGASYFISPDLYSAQGLEHPRHRAVYGALRRDARVALYHRRIAALGMSMNPARTFASALAANLWTGLWIYFTAPPLGMVAAAKVYAMQKGPANVKCAKLHHQNSKRCIFCQL